MQVDSNDPADSTTTLTNAEPSTDLSDSSDAMAVWADPLSTKRDVLIKAPYSNQSQYEVPTGMVETAADSATTDVTGVYYRGAFTDVEGNPLSGKATLTDGEFINGSARFNGPGVVSGPPPAYAILGEDAESIATLRFFFDPDIAGILYIDDSFRLTKSAGAVQYGAVEGKVLDFNGDPVEGDIVTGPKFGTTTDADGSFKAVAPGGESFDLKALGGSYSFNLTITGGSTESVTFKFPQITVRVVDGDYEPVEGANIVVRGEIYITDQNGEITIPDIPIGTHRISVMDLFERDVVVNSPNTEYPFKVGPESSAEWVDGDGLGGVRLQLNDAETGRPIQSLRVRETKTESTNTTGADGRVSLLTPDIGEDLDVVIGEADRRYKATRVDADMPSDSMIEVDLEILPKTVVSNT